MKIRRLLWILALIFIVFIIGYVNIFFEYHVIVDRFDYECLQKRAAEVTWQEELRATDWLRVQGFTVDPPLTNEVIFKR